MGESAPYDPQDELRKLLAGAGLYGQQIQQLQPRMQLGQQMMQPQTAQGRQVGNTYVASSPLEHLSNAIRQIVGAKITGDVAGQQQQLLAQQGNARQQWMQARQTAQYGGQAGPGPGTPYQQFATPLDQQGVGQNMAGRPPDPQAAQNLDMMGVASGDPDLTAAANFGMQREQLGRQNHILENTLRHQTELERQGRERLGQGDAKVAALIRGLELRGIKFNSNTGEFENVANLLKPGGGATDGTAPKPYSKMEAKALQALGSDLDPRSKTGGMSGLQNRLDAAGRLNALARDPEGAIKDLTPEQMREVSTSLDSLIRGGNGTGAVSQIEHLSPPGIHKDLARFAEWLTSEPQGAGQQAFTKMMLDTADRETGVAKGQISKTQRDRLAKHLLTFRRWQDDATKTAASFGVAQPDIDALLGNATAPAASPPPAAAPAPGASSATGIRRFTRQNGKLVEVTDAH